MNDILTSSVRNSPPKKMNLAYGLTILIDLADTFHRQGNYLTIISAKHGLPLAELEPIAARLEKAGLLERHPEDCNRLKLKEVPEGQWILNVIPNLIGALENGQMPSANNQK